MNQLELLILAVVFLAAVTIFALNACHRKQTKLIRQQDKIIEILLNLSELTAVYGDAEKTFNQLHCRSHSLILAPLQFLLFSAKDQAMRSEQYEVAKDIDQLLSLIQEAIKVNK